MNRLRLLAAAPLLVLPLLAGCSGEQVEERARDVASDAAGSASSAAADAVREQVCKVVADADISPQDVEVLRNLVDAADAAGLDAEVLDPLRQIAESGDRPPADAVSRLEQACRPTS